MVSKGDKRLLDLPQMETETLPAPPHENGTKVPDKEAKTPPKVPKRAKRSRSKTPQKKKTVNGNDEEKTLNKPADIVEEVEDKDKNGTHEVIVEEEVKPEEDNVEMESLVLASDEPDPELQFDESSDKDSGKGSPIQTRCKTRRSQSRNIPTPKTPKTSTPEVEEDLSTVAQLGSDSSRLDFDESQDKSFSDTIRSLSARKTIRPINDLYRQQAFKNLKLKVQLDTPLKRKRSVSPEERKKFKQEECLGTLARLKSKFGEPTLMGYKDGSKDFHTEVVEGEKKSWCVVM